MANNPDNKSEVKAASLTRASMPKDAQVMTAILKDMGVSDFEPRVVTQMLEFSYRYVTNVLEDARAVSAHARKKTVDVEDVQLAVQMYVEQNVTSPPSRETLLDMARAKNSAPLPIPKPTCGLRLPPDRHCLTATNYRVKVKPKHSISGYGGNSSLRDVRYNTGGKIPQFTVSAPPSVIQINPTSSQVSVQPDQPMFQISLSTQSMGNEPMKRKANQMTE